MIDKLENNGATDTDSETASTISNLSEMTILPNQNNINIEEIKDQINLLDANLDCLGSEITGITNDLLNIGISVDLKARFEDSKKLYQNLKLLANNTDKNIKEHNEIVEKFATECTTINDNLKELDRKIFNRCKKLYNLDDLLEDSDKNRNVDRSKMLLFSPRNSTSDTNSSSLESTSTSKFTECKNFITQIIKLQAALDTTSIKIKHREKPEIYETNKTLISNIFDKIAGIKETLHQANILLERGRGVNFFSISRIGYSI